MSIWRKHKKLGRRKRNKIQMRKYQIDSVNQAIDALIRRGLSFLLCLPAQTGKTFTFYSIVKKSNLITLFVTPRKFITEQGASEAEKFFNSDDVGYINSNVTDKIMKRSGRSKLQDAISNKIIVVADLETVVKRVEDNPNMFKHFELLGIDEAHYKAERVNYLRSLFINACHLGITATPHNGKGEYIDGWDIRFDKYDTKYMVDNGYLARVEAHHADVYSDKRAYSQYLAECASNNMSEQGISKQSKKVGKIVTEAIIKHNLDHKIINKKDRALVYAGSIEQSERIVEAYRNKGINAVCVHSLIPNTSEVINDFNDGGYSVLVSVSMLIMGVVIKNVKNAVFFRDIGSYVTLIQVNNRGRGGSPEMTKIPNKQFWYTPTLIKMGNPDLFVPHEKGEIIPKAEPSCKSCGVPTKDYPMEVIREIPKNGFVSVLKKCSVCGAVTESDRFTNKADAYNGTINMIPVDMQIQAKKRIAKKKTLNQIDDLVNQIADAIRSKKLKDGDLLITYFKNNAISQSRKDGEYLYKVLRMIKANNPREIEKKVLKYLT